MRDCFKVGVLALVGAALAFSAPPASKATSVVRVDKRTGRLVRSIVVPAKPAASVARPVQAGLKEVIDETAKRYQVDPLLVHSVISVESGYNPYALSPKGAQGLMQLIPSTARRFGVTNSFDVRQNIEGGVRYLKYLNSLFPDQLQLTLAAYNAGEGAVWRYGNSVPPYRETRDYVQKVGARYHHALRKSPPQVAQQQPQPEQVASAVPAAERYSAIETYVDAAGRLCIRSKPPEETLTR